MSTVLPCVWACSVSPPKQSRCIQQVHIVHIVQVWGKGSLIYASSALWKLPMKGLWAHGKIQTNALGCHLCFVQIKSTNFLVTDCQYIQINAFLFSIFLDLGSAAPAWGRMWTTCFLPTALGVDTAAFSRSLCCSVVPALTLLTADCVPAELTFLDRWHCASTASKQHCDRTQEIVGREDDKGKKMKTAPKSHHAMHTVNVKNCPAKATEKVCGLVCGFAN